MKSVQKTSALSRVGWHSIVAAHHLPSRVDPQRADAFFARVAGEQTGEDDPAALLRNQLVRSADSGQQRMLALAILAWNSVYLGEPLRSLRWRQEGDRPQRFPTVADLPEDDGDDLNHHRQPNYSVVVDPRDLRIELELITPSRAEQRLSANDKNRKSILRVVEKYARDMAAGNWALNGQTIKVSKSGKLLDGQHRCGAAVKSGKPFHAMIVHGLPDEIFDTLDSGPARSLGEVLGTRGEKNSNSLAAALQKLWLYLQDAPTLHSMRASHAELLRVLDQHPEIRRSVNFVLYRLHDVVPSGIAGTTHYLASRSNAEAADHFASRVGDGVGLGLNNPIRRFREAMMRDWRNRRNPFREVEKWALMIKAYNAFLCQSEVRLLVWRQASGEAFPRI